MFCVVNGTHGQDVVVRLYESEEVELFPLCRIKAVIQRDPLDQPTNVLRIVLKRDVRSCEDIEEA